MAKEGSFLGEFIKERKMVGSVTPSSSFLTKRMLKPIDFEAAASIVELGPGTGVFTKEILKRMNSNCKLFSFELNEQFYQKLQDKFTDDRLILINDSATMLTEHLLSHGIESVDYIISALPLSVIDEKIKAEIMEVCLKHLKKGGTFIQFQYSLNANKMLREKFTEVKLDFTAMNFPPAFVYKCKH